jgi:hypothetical protein
LVKWLIVLRKQQIVGRSHSRYQYGENLKLIIGSDVSIGDLYQLLYILNDHSWWNSIVLKWKEEWLKKDVRKRVRIKIWHSISELFGTSDEQFLKSSYSRDQLGLGIKIIEWVKGGNYNDLVDAL